MWIGNNDDEDGSDGGSRKKLGDSSGARDANSKGSSKQETNKKNKQKQKKGSKNSNTKVPSVIDLSDSLIITKQSAQQSSSSASASKSMFHDERLNKKQKTTIQNNATQKQQDKGMDRVGYSTDTSKIQSAEASGRKSVDQLSSSLRGLKFMKRKDDELEAKEMIAEQKREASDFFWTIAQPELVNVKTNDVDMAYSVNEEEDENNIGFSIADDSDELAAIGNFGRRAFGNDNLGKSSFGAAKDSSTHAILKDKGRKHDRNNDDDNDDVSNEEDGDEEEESDRDDTVFRLANMTRGHTFENAAKALNKKRDKEKEKVQKDAAKLATFSYSSSSRKRR